MKHLYRKTFPKTTFYFEGRGFYYNGTFYTYTVDILDATIEPDYLKPTKIAIRFICKGKNKHIRMSLYSKLERLILNNDLELVLDHARYWVYCTCPLIQVLYFGEPTDEILEHIKQLEARHFVRLHEDMDYWGTKTVKKIFDEAYQRYQILDADGNADLPDDFYEDLYYSFENSKCFYINSFIENEKCIEFYI